MNKTIILIHGRNFKPPRHALEELWFDALRHGVKRDFPEKWDAYEGATREFVYYGDYNNDFLSKALGQPTPDDTESRLLTLEQLKTYKNTQFQKRTYESLPGVDWKKEFFANMFAGILGSVGLSEPAITHVAPDMREYWNDETQFGSDVRYPMIDPLRKAMDRNDKILVIAYSLGSMIAYDTFWKFCHMGEYRPDYCDKKINLFITIGAPLADETVKRKLKGASISGHRRYPNNIDRWINFAAEDDYISHDGRIANDFREMKDWKLIRSIADRRIYNLAVRDGKSNPHHAVGYLVHPQVVAAVAKWL
jgi:hypothetical protein